jgi:hypothetical protein
VAPGWYLYFVGFHFVTQPSLSFIAASGRTEFPPDTLNNIKKQFKKHKYPLGAVGDEWLPNAFYNSALFLVSRTPPDPRSTTACGRVVVTPTCEAPTRASSRADPDTRKALTAHRPMLFHAIRFRNRSFRISLKTKQPKP